MRSRLSTVSSSWSNPPGWLLVTTVAILLSGCVIDREEPPTNAPPPPPVVRVYKYVVRDGEVGSVLASGCTAFDLGESDLAEVLQVSIPLGSPFVVELEKRSSVGYVASQHDTQAFCDGSIGSEPSGHYNPRCLVSPEPQRIEVLETSVLDTKGIPYVTDQDGDLINGYPGDIERYRLIVYATGKVWLNMYGKPCPPQLDGSREPYNSVGLLTVLP